MPVLDEHEDGGSGVGSADADVVESSVVAEGDRAGFVNDVAANPPVGVGDTVAWGGFRACVPQLPPSPGPYTTPAVETEASASATPKVCTGTSGPIREIDRPRHTTRGIRTVGHRVDRRRAGTHRAAIRPTGPPFRDFWLPVSARH